MGRNNELGESKCSPLIVPVRAAGLGAKGGTRPEGESASEYVGWSNGGNERRGEERRGEKRRRALRNAVGRAADM